MPLTTARPSWAATAIQVGRYFYSLAICGIGAQQIRYADFRPVLVPQWPAQMHQPVLGYASGALLLAAGLLMALGIGATRVALALGGLFLLLFLFCHVPAQVFFSPYSFHLGLWSDPLKELALSGGALILAAGLHRLRTGGPLDRYGKLAATGRVFFCLMLVAFGIDHFIYTDFVASLVPAWVPGHLFWTYFAGVALIGAGVAILLGVLRLPVSLLLAVMLFLWLIVLHVPRAAVATAADKGNELTSVFEALAFSGVALVIAALAAVPVGPESYLKKIHKV